MSDEGRASSHAKDILSLSLHDQTSLAPQELGHGQAEPRHLLVHPGQQDLSQLQILSTFPGPNHLSNCLIYYDLFYPNIKSDIGRRYKSCNDCLVNSRSTVDKHNNVPEELTSLYPGEQLTVDFANISGKDVMLIVDKVSGHLH